MLEWRSTGVGVDDAHCHPSRHNQTAPWLIQQLIHWPKYFRLSEHWNISCLNDRTVEQLFFSRKKKKNIKIHSSVRVFAHRFMPINVWRHIFSNFFFPPKNTAIQLHDSYIIIVSTSIPTIFTKNKGKKKKIFKFIQTETEQKYAVPFIRIFVFIIGVVGCCHLSHSPSAKRALTDFPHSFFFRQFRFRLNT